MSKKETNFSFKKNRAEKFDLKDMCEVSQIPIKTADGEIISVKWEVMKKFGTLYQMIKICPKSPENTIVPLPKVNANILRCIIKYIEYHLDDEPVDPKMQSKTYNSLFDKVYTFLPSWDVEFFETNKNDLIAILDAADFLDVGGLYESGCQHVENMIQGLKPEAIPKVFKIKNDIEDLGKSEGE